MTKQLKKVQTIPQLESLLPLLRGIGMLLLLSLFSTTGEAKLAKVSIGYEAKIGKISYSPPYGEKVKIIEDFDLTTYSLLQVKVREVKGNWSLWLENGENCCLQEETSKKGLFTYNLEKIYRNKNPEKASFTLKFRIRGRTGSEVVIDYFRIVREIDFHYGLHQSSITDCINLPFMTNIL